MAISEHDIYDLRKAKALLEHPSLAAKLTNALGTPIEKGFDMLPQKWAEIVQIATHKSLEKALHFAVATMNKRLPGKSANLFHKLAVSTSGAAGGAFGLSSLPIELPVSTVIMLRSIMDTARSEGEDIHSIETQLNCLEVFALGGSTKEDDAAETGYYAVRATLSKAVSDAAKFITERGVTERGAPVLVRFISTIASRFGILVSEKTAATAVPLIGAAGGAMINALFIDHFQKMARGHFIIRRLERLYGKDEVRRQYDFE